MTESNKTKIAVIGGGAAGFFSALSSAEHNPEAEVSIYEATNKLLAKVLISGGGRCNVTNNTPEVSDLIKNYPRGSKELRGPFSKFATKDTIAWFAKNGVELKTEPDKRMFPITDSSETIAKCLINKAKHLGVNICTKQKITKITRTNQNQFQMTINGAEVITVDKIILTTGGTKSSLELARSLGHTITDLVPSLFSFEINDPKLLELAGVSFPDIRLELMAKSGNKFKQQGPVLITHWGFSGPATIKLSALAAKDLFISDYSATLKINFIPSENWESILKILIDHKEKSPRQVAHSDSFLNIPKRYWAKIIDQIITKDKQTWAEFTKQQLQNLATELTQGTFSIAGKGKFKEEFVTCGGVHLKEVDFTRMESKIVPGLFFAGEVLDIDGITGGFNFQSAWTTGWIAGQAAT